MQNKQDIKLYSDTKKSIGTNPITWVCRCKDRNNLDKTFCSGCGQNRVYLCKYCSKFDEINGYRFSCCGREMLSALYIAVPFITCCGLNSVMTKNAYRIIHPNSNYPVHLKKYALNYLMCARMAGIICMRIDIEESKKISSHVDNVSLELDKQTIKIKPATVKDNSFIRIIDHKTKSISKEKCTICITDITDCDKPCEIPCGHQYCFGCITAWFKTNNTCPVCKAIPTSTTKKLTIEKKTEHLDDFSLFIAISFTIIETYFRIISFFKLLKIYFRFAAIYMYISSKNLDI